MTPSDGDVVSAMGWAESLVGLIAPFASSSTAPSLVARYREPHRHYHDVTHLTEMLEHVALVAEQFQQVRAVVYAALYHDAIYDPRRKDNEARSAELARRELTEFLDEADLRVVSELILATAAHGAALVQAHPDVGLFLDCDSAILGAEDGRYRAYAAGVRQEYAHVSKLMYRLGRGKFLKSMLKRPTLFHTSGFEARFGDRARRNLRAELNAL